MKNNIYNTDDLAIEMIATGSTIDDDPGYQGKVYRILTWTFRMNHVGLNRWIMSDTVTVWPECYETREEYEAVKAEKERQREDLEAEVKELLGRKLSAGSFVLSKNMAEIFTAVAIEEVTAEEPKKQTVAERLHRSASMLNAMLCCMI